MAKIKILVVGAPDSIHTARFVSLLQEIGYEVRLFQCEYHYSQDEHLNETTIHVAFPYSPPINGNVIKGYYPVLNSFVRLLCRNEPFQKLFRLGIDYFYTSKRVTRPKHLIKLIKSWKPDILFSLKMQNDGYTVSEAKGLLGKNFKPKWIHFNWGTDIEFFGKHPDYVAEHLPKIKKLLSQCDFHIADCKRDVRQALEFGLKGVSLGDCIAQGGFSLDYIRTIMEARSNDKRDVILVKGRQGGYVGKAFNVLQALHRIPHLLRGYKVKIFYSSPNVQAVADFLKKVDGVDYEIVPRLPYRDLLALYAKSRIAISASDVDGTPGFLLEAMAMGALPIHSDMESIREWVEDGVNGLLFPVDDVSSLTGLIEKALKDDLLLETARKKNWEIVKARVDIEVVKDHMKDLIENRVMPSLGES